MRLLFLLLICLWIKPANAQQEVSTFDITHSPKKAVFLSAVLPGAGQIYNRKYWKAPIVYAGLGISIYFLLDNQKNYKLYRNEYLYRINNNGALSNPDLSIYTDGNLKTIIDQYQRWRDLSVIAIAGVYAIQLIDAAVDGYLWRFDVSNDLSLNFRPSVFSSYSGITPALKVQIKF